MADDFARGEIAPELARRRSTPSGRTLAVSATFLLLRKVLVNGDSVGEGAHEIKPEEQGEIAQGTWDAESRENHINSVKRYFPGRTQSKTKHFHDEAFPAPERVRFGDKEQLPA